MTDPTNNSYQEIMEFVNSIAEIFYDEGNKDINSVHTIINDFCNDHGLSDKIRDQMISGLDDVYQTEGEILEDDVLLCISKALPEAAPLTEIEIDELSEALFNIDNGDFIDAHEDNFDSPQEWSSSLSSLYKLKDEMEAHANRGISSERQTEFRENTGLITQHSSSQIAFTDLTRRQKFVDGFIRDLELRQDNPSNVQSTIDGFAEHTKLGKSFADHMKTSITAALMANDGEPLTQADIIHCMGLAAEHIKNRRISPESIEQAAILLEYEDAKEGGPNDLGRTALQAPMAKLVDKMKI